MDALSDILRMIRFSSTVYFRTDFAPPWGMQIDAGKVAQFHMVARGNCWLKSENFDEPVLLNSGDIVVFLRGDAHWLADSPGSDKIPGIKVVEAHRKNQKMFEGEKASVTLVCGHFEYNRNFEHPFIQSLPSFIHISDSERRELSWLETVTQVILQETDSGNPGSDAVVERLGELLFIQIIRTYMLGTKNEQSYLSALKDKQINNALRLIHTEPSKNWTLQNIARSIGMSRSAFAVRFKELVGVTPMNYITAWRMFKARELLENKQLPLSEIAEQVGYMSEAAFNRAFKRRFNANPGYIRRSLTV